MEFKDLTEQEQKIVTILREQPELMGYAWQIIKEIREHGCPKDQPESV